MRLVFHNVQWRQERPSVCHHLPQDVVRFRAAQPAPYRFAMKTALVTLLVWQVSCTAYGHVHRRDAMQMLLAGLFGARGGGRYGNPNAGYSGYGPALAHNSGYGFREPYGGRNVYRQSAVGPMFSGSGRELFGRYKRQAVSENVLTRGFSYVRMLDADTCVLRGSCEAGARPEEYGQDGQLALRFVL